MSSSLTQILHGAADVKFFTSIRNYVYARIEYFMEHTLSNNLTLALTIITGLLTIWVMIQGFLIVTGRSQEGLKGFVFNLGKSYFIILIALSVSASSGFSLRLLTDQLTDGVAQVMSGKSENGSACLTGGVDSIMGCKIDKNLLTMQGVMAYVSQIDTADDEILNDQATRAKWFAGIGTAGPAIIAGTMLMMYRIAIALFIGFGPLFILSLLFKKTAPLFQKWIYYGLATIFSSVMLAVMADISADLVETVSASLFVADGVLDLFGGSSGGVMQAATQQLGLGLILSTLLITVPPMAGMFFNGVMGSFSPFPAFGGWNNGPNQVQSGGNLPPTLGGGYGATANTQTVKDNTNQRDSELSRNTPSSVRNSDFGSTAGVKSTDTYTSGVMSPANNAVASKTTTGGVTDSPKTKPQEDQHV